MKSTNNRYMAMMALAAAVTAPSVFAQVIDAPQGVNLNLTGEIIQSPVIHEPSQNGVDWLQTGWGFANRIVPVGQFTGYEDDGTAIPALDLIPLRTTSISIVDPGTGIATPLDGKNIYNSDGTLTGNRTVTQGGNSIAFTGGVVTVSPVGATSGLSFASGSTPGNVRLYSGTSIEIQSGSALQFVAHSNGNVGIGMGTGTPIAPLHVGKTAAVGNYSGVWSAITYNAGAVVGTGNNSYPNIPISLACEGGIAAKGEIASNSYFTSYQTVTFSDERVKEGLKFSDTAQDLGILNQIKITDYKMKDKVAFGDASFKKVIAQQVETVYPIAVTKRHGFVPDVMQLSKAMPSINGRFTLSLEKPSNLKVGDKVQFIDARDNRETAAIEAVEGETLTVSLTGVKDGENVFVYGHEVNDFRGVDYDALSMLNISATQELSKKIDHQQNKIASLEAENAELKKLAGEMKELKALVAALEGKSNETVTVSLVK